MKLKSEIDSLISEKKDAVDTAKRQLLKAEREYEASLTLKHEYVLLKSGPQMVHTIIKPLGSGTRKVMKLKDRKLGPLAEKLLKAITTEEMPILKIVSKMMGKSVDTVPNSVYTSLKGLQKRKLIQRNKNNGKTVWSLVKKAA